MSATCSRVSIGFISIRPLRTCSLKWLYLRAICFVPGQIFGALDNSIAPLLSSNNLHLTLRHFDSMFNVFSNCSRCSIIGMISLIYCDSAMYYASVVDKDISDFNLDAHSIEKLIHLMIYPVREYTEAGSSYLFVDHPPAKSASMNHSSPLSFLDTLLVHFIFYPSGTWLTFLIPYCVKPLDWLKILRLNALCMRYHFYD